MKRHLLFSKYPKTIFYLEAVVVVPTAVAAAVANVVVSWEFEVEKQATHFHV